MFVTQLCFYYDDTSLIELPVDLELLEVAQSRRPPLPEIVLWIAASRSPSESQTSECSDLLSRSRATLVIVAQRQPGKLDGEHEGGKNQECLGRNAGALLPRVTGLMLLISNDGCATHV